MAVGTLYPNGSNAADKAASTSGGKTEKTAGDKPCDENGMGERVLLKEGRVGQGGVKAACRAGSNVGLDFKACMVTLRKRKIQCFLLLPNPYAPACTTFMRLKRRRCVDFRRRVRQHANSVRVLNPIEIGFAAVFLPAEQAYF